MTEPTPHAAQAQPPRSASRPPLPRVRVAVVLERKTAPNQWEDYGFRAVDVVEDDGRFGPTVRHLRDDGQHAEWLHPGFEVELHPQEWKGYYLNLSSGKPVWFVVWRRDEDDPSIATPVAVSLSYIEADRWMSAEERVDIIALPEHLRRWLHDFTQQHHDPHASHRRVRAQSFLAPHERGSGGGGVGPVSSRIAPSVVSESGVASTPEAAAKEDGHAG